MIVTVSKPAAEVLRKSTFICANDLGVNIPDSIELKPEVRAEIEGLIRAWKISVQQAATAALAGILEREQLLAPDARHQIH